MARVFSAIAGVATFIASTSLCALVLVLAWQVFGRYVLNASPGWTEPVALSLMSIVALFGAALGVRNERHFNFPTLVDSAPAGVRAALKTLSRLIAVAFGVALAGFGGFLTVDSWGVRMAGAPLPDGVSFVGLAGGGALLAVFALERLLTGDPIAGEG